jgi:hypothetical protein
MLVRHDTIWTSKRVVDQIEEQQLNAQLDERTGICGVGFQKFSHALPQTLEEARGFDAQL